MINAPGFGKDDDGITSLVRDLKRDYPPAAAGLLAKMLPPADEKPEGAGGAVTAINILSIPVGAFLVGDPLRVATEEEARQFSKADTLLMIEHQPEEMIAAPVESAAEVEIAQIDQIEPTAKPIVEPPIERARAADRGTIIMRPPKLLHRFPKPSD